MVKLEDLDAEAKRNQATVERRIRILGFWKQAECDGAIDSLVRASRPMPQDREAGLENLRERVYGKEKFIKGVILLFRFGLNLFHLFQIIASGDLFRDEWVIGDEWQNVTFSYDRIEICHMEGSNTGCFGKWQVSRLNALKLELLVECVIGIALSLVTICILTSFFLAHCKGWERLATVWPDKERHSQNWARNLPSNMPWFFIFGPRISAGWSSMIFLQFMSPRVMTNVLHRGDISFWAIFFGSSLCPFQCCAWNEKFKERLERGKFKKVSWYRSMFKFALFAVVYFVLLAFSLQALIVKFTIVSYILTADFRSWTSAAILQFLVFINQLVGSFDLFDPEFERVILFIFGQSDCVMGDDDIAAAITYFRLLCEKVSELRTQTFRSRAAVLAFLSTISANDLQKLFLSPYVEKNMCKYTATRTYIEKELHTTDSAREFFHGLVDALKVKEKNNDEARADQMLKEALRSRKKSMTELRDELIKGIYQVRLGEEDDESEKLRLASVVQEHIDECKLMQFAQEKDPILVMEIALGSGDENEESESNSLMQPVSCTSSTGTSMSSARSCIRHDL